MCKINKSISFNFVDEAGQDLVVVADDFWVLEVSGALFKLNIRDYLVGLLFSLSHKLGIVLAHVAQNALQVRHLALLTPLCFICFCQRAILTLRFLIRVVYFSLVSRQLLSLLVSDVFIYDFRKVIWFYFVSNRFNLIIVMYFYLLLQIQVKNLRTLILLVHFPFFNLRSQPLHGFLFIPGVF